MRINLISYQGIKDFAYHFLRNELFMQLDDGTGE